MPPPKSGDDPNVSREYTPDEVQAITERASRLLDELHEVMSEMARRLNSFVGEKP